MKDIFLVDFCCLRNRLIVELDGGQHNESKFDPIRDKYLHDQGFTILRIWNNELNQNLEGVAERILEYLKK